MKKPLLITPQNTTQSRKKYDYEKLLANPTGPQTLTSGLTHFSSYHPRVPRTRRLQYLACEDPMEPMTYNTNANAARNLQGWKDVSALELGIGWGLQSTRQFELSRSPRLLATWGGAFMYFHQETLRVRRLWHSNVVLDQLYGSPQRYRVPPSHVAMDERMVRAGTYKMPSRLVEQRLEFHPDRLTERGFR